MGGGGRGEVEGDGGGGSGFVWIGEVRFGGGYFPREDASVESPRGALYGESRSQGEVMGAERVGGGRRGGGVRETSFPQDLEGCHVAGPFHQ